MPDPGRRTAARGSTPAGGQPIPVPLRSRAPMNLRAEFPVVERLAYLNAGTDGPIPAVAARAAREELEPQLAEGRVRAHFERRFELHDELRAGYARVLGCAVEDVATTASTSDGIGRVLAGLDLGPDDEILTSDQEHPGLIGPLIAARRRGAAVRAAPMRELGGAGRRDPARRRAPAAPGARAARRSRARHDARGLLARELGHRRDGAGGAGAGRR